jgi:hypothetical protein
VKLKIIAIIVVLVGLGILAVWLPRRNAQAARKAWKEKAVLQIAAWENGPAISNDVLMLRPVAPTHDNEVGWVGTNVLLMTNGEHLVYAARHGRDNPLNPIHHLFLARGSDGRWLYSTYHFCNDMVGIFAEDPPGSLAEFQKTYFARQFDGKSDECLQKTWPAEK